MRRDGRANLLWAFFCQLCQSGQTFVMTVAVARSTSSSEFGAYSTALVLLVLAAGATRTRVVEPFTVRHGGTHRARSVLAGDCGVGVLLVASLQSLLLLVGAVVVGAGLGEGGSVFFPSIVAAGGALTWISLQEAVRYVLFAQERFRVAAAMEASFAGLFCVALGLLATTGAIGSWQPMCAWGVSCLLVAAVFWRPAMGPGGSLNGGRGWLQETKVEGRRFIGEYVSGQGAGQAVLLLLSAISGPSAAGALRGALTLTGPLGALLPGVHAAFTPKAVQRSDAFDAAGVLRVCRRSTAVGVSLVIGWCLLIVILPAWVIDEALGESSSSAMEVFPAVTLQFTFAALAIGGVIGLRVLSLSEASFRIRVVGSVLTLGAGCFGAAIGGALGSACGVALATMVVAPLLWRELIKGARRI